MRTQQTPLVSKNASMEDVDSDEKCIAIVRKHIFGLVLIYLQAAAGLTVSLGLIFFLVSGIASQDQTGLYQYAGMFSIGVVILTVIIMAAVTFIYNQNKLIVTDQNVTQTLRFGLFTHKTSQLTLASVEDVSAAQHGIFAAIFNYGTLTIETAGETANFYFSYCPNPNYHAKQILEARERFVFKPHEH